VQAGSSGSEIRVTDVAIETAHLAGGDLRADCVDLVRDWPLCVWIR